MFASFQRLIFTAFVATSVFMLSSCGIVYKVDVYQGNLLDADQVEQLETGMTKQQVTSIVGTPSIADPFHHDRWDYMATKSLRGGEIEKKNLTLTFSGDTLSAIGGDYFETDNDALSKRMLRYGNLKKDKDKKRGR